ncbi:MAG: hypothetical protein WBW61_04400 [Rhodanobacteraceae bacterium]
MLLDVLRITFALGLPVAALSWLLFYRLYSRGELARDADHKAIRSSLKQVKQATKESGAHADSLLHAKWMKFGGGFYGVAALWTLIVIEGGGVLSTIAHPSSIEQMFHGGPIEFIVNLLVNQFTTFLQAILWITWWPGEEHGQVGWMALVVAYVGYLAGLNLARHETELGRRLTNWDWRAQVRSWFAGDKDA